MKLIEVVRRHGGALLAVGLALAGAPPAYSADPSKVMPDAISGAWQKQWPVLMKFMSKPSGPFPRPDDVAGWDLAYAKTEKLMRLWVGGSPRRWHVDTRPDTLGPVPVLRLLPPDWHDDGRVLVYVHGGGFTSMSVQSSLGISALLAAETGLQVIALDYTVAPPARWQQVTDQVVGAYQALLAQGIAANSIALIGDSAGGSIVAGTTLKMRDMGLPLPAALVLWSPWSDVSGVGDTYRTLADAEPMLSGASLQASALAYASVEDQKHPYVSPVYGDYSKGYPATLIQGGTREIFLSNFVRQYQAIKSGGGDATLDLYEGMIHVFQSMVPASPESKQALRTVKTFLDQHMKARGDAAALVRK